MLQVYMKAWDTANDRWVNVVCDTSGRILTTFPRGRKPTDTLNGSDIAINTIFDWLKGYIPNSGDQVIVSGGVVHTSWGYMVSYAKRYDSTTIYLYRAGINTADQNHSSGYLTVNDGDITTWDEVNLTI